MIGSEVIQRLMMDKWEAFARVRPLIIKKNGNIQWGLIKRMIILVVHCISVSVAAGLRPTELDRLYFNRAYASYHQTNEKSPEELQHLGPRVDDWVTCLLPLSYQPVVSVPAGLRGVQLCHSNSLLVPAVHGSQGTGNLVICHEHGRHCSLETLCLNHRGQPLPVSCMPSPVD